MQAQTEQIFINKFVIKDKQERYLSFLSKDKTRKKFTSGLYHFKDFNWKLFRQITGSEDERETILAKVNSRKNISTCYVISVNSEFDGKLIPIAEAIKNVVGQEGTILVFGDAEIVYYEGEAPSNRYINV